MDGRVKTRAEAYRNRGRRLDAEQRQRRQDREIKARETKKEVLRTKGRTMDQVEHCYRQHTPAQIAHSDEMQGKLVVAWEDICS